MARNKRAGEGCSNQPPALRYRGDDEATSAPPRSPSPASSNPFDDLDEGTRDLIRSLYQEEDEACNNYAEETKKTGRLEAHLEAASEDMALTARAQLITDARVAVLESQVWVLYAAAITATEVVNAQGDTVAACLQYTPNHVWDVSDYGVHRGAAIALAVVETLSENYLQTLHPIFPKGKAREDFEELIDNLDKVSTAISAEFSLDAVISNVLADE
ncbi:uncharacterized protein LOC120712010 isoform X2 [Panicum virgatum]|uniref:uncharacterized protein LOC120712010 isoform X2 n=1 Tax=Panicum virgatum TaxID=38727 RepID=UPI0019D574B6|nr:uncharacterized protein LOC120712010 isoform X2 [Panicum virgatum]